MLTAFLFGTVVGLGFAIYVDICELKEEATADDNHTKRIRND